LQKNDIINLTISGYSSEGFGVARHEGQVVFVRNAIDGEEIAAKILKVNKNAAFAVTDSVTAPSPERVTPDCPHYPKCGGCGLRHISYAEQLRFKAQRVTQTLERIGGVAAEVEIVPSPQINGYRNKAMFEVRSGAIGFFRSGSHDVIAVGQCRLQSDTANRVLEIASEYIQKHADCPIRNIFVRTDENRAQIAVITYKRDRHTAEALTQKITEAVPGVEFSIFFGSQDGRNNVPLSAPLKHLSGLRELPVELCGFRYNTAPKAFFQVNKAQTEQMLQYITQTVSALPEYGRILDLYCGCGAITLPLSRLAESVTGAEIVPEAIAVAKQAAADAGVSNAEFLCADAGEAAEQLAVAERFDVVVTDPPRKGLLPEATAAIIKLAPKRIVYVSCDPAALARDVRLFAEAGYEFVSARAFDMFPGTVHVETVALLSLTGKTGISE
jgi:23S rRNA (uracil1939-C5)-methyltransferase